MWSDIPLVLTALWTGVSGGGGEASLYQASAIVPKGVQQEHLLVASDQFSPLFNAVESYRRPKYYTRGDWKADRKVRNGKSNWSQALDQTLRRQLPPEASKISEALRPKVVQTKGVDGKVLRSPVAENKVVKKVILHHTGENPSRRTLPPMKLIQAIYQYHTVRKGWGDIGYNFLIDSKGNIYEGRAGGPKTVGTHTAWYNSGTIGLALIGNFNVEVPSEAQLRSTEILIAYLADKYDINIKGSSEWLDVDSHNVTGHGHVAHKDHGTSCPGKHLGALLPVIRRKAHDFYVEIQKNDAPTTRRRLSRLSKAAPKVRGRIKREEIPNISLGRIMTNIPLRREQNKVLDIPIRNGTKEAWPRGSLLKPKQVPDGMYVQDFRSLETIRPGETGTFRARARIGEVPNGVYHIELQEAMPSIKKQDRIISIPLQVSAGDKTFLTSFKKARKTTAPKASLSASLISRRSAWQRRTPRQDIKLKPAMAADRSANGPNLKIKLASFEASFANVESNDWIQITSLRRTITDVPPKTEIKIVHRQGQLYTEVGGKTWALPSLALRTFSADGVLKMKSYNRGLGGATPYNQFRRELHFYQEHGKLIAVNKAPLEETLWGLAESTQGEPIHKKHTIFVLARSYAYVYSHFKRKFGTQLYDLEDSPRTSQFYLGYDWERIRHEQRAIVEQTKGQMITLDGKPVIGPYFSESNGHSSDKWLSQYPWAKVIPLPYDKEARGHGFGLSANTSRVLANKGWDYHRIIDHFFTGLGVETKY